MAKKQFKAESKKLLDLMINSIYTHKDIFLRELISNASDASDKLYYRYLQSGVAGVRKNDFVIELIPDKDLRTLTIRDHGIGMTMEELESNLGTIARSGSQLFKQEQAGSESAEEAAGAKAAKTIDIIGQFGVGFYSAFMVADLVTVTSRAYGSEQAYRWQSRGADGYTVEEAIQDETGTEVVLHLKEDSGEDEYSTYLDPYTLKALVKKYSDYIHYPIRLADETLNAMEPIWKRQKSKVKPEEYNEYYKAKCGDYLDPARVIRTSVEGVSSFTALLFIPSHTPFDYYSKDYEKGLSLYSSGVMIMEKCPDLIPDYFSFVKGLVDSQDLSLNISRETLQQDRQLKNIAKNVEKKIRRDLESWLKDDREGYEKFFAEFGKQMKVGLYENFGANRDVLQDLVLFWSSTEKKPVTFAEYVSRMKEDQTCIYYAAGESVDKIDLLPQTEYVKAKGYEILYLTDEVDEFVLQMLMNYKEKPFRSVSAEEMSESETEEERARIAQAEEENKDLLAYLREILTGKVSEVKLSPRLTASAVCLTTKGGISLEMEKVFQQMPFDQGFRAERVLELNPDHEVLGVLREAFAAGEEGKEKVKTLASLLYDQALLISGQPIDDPVAFSRLINELIVKAR